MQTGSSLKCRANFGVWTGLSLALSTPVVILEPIVCVWGFLIKSHSKSKSCRFCLHAKLHLQVFITCMSFGTSRILYFLSECLYFCLRIYALDNLLVFYLLARYSTIYTMFPVFSLVLDKDVKSEVAMLYPELYKDLLKVRETSVCLFQFKARSSPWFETLWMCKVKYITNRYGTLSCVFKQNCFKGKFESRDTTRFPGSLLLNATWNAIY